MTDGVSLARLSPSADYPRSRGGAHAARGRRTGARDLAVAASVCAILATAVPLALFQIPNGAAYLPAGTADPIGVLRACGLALPAIMIAAPFGAAAVRRAGAAWPVLLAGLFTIALADLAGGAVRSVPLVAIDRALHGIGAGLALPGAGALAMNMRRARTWTWGVWLLVTVAALAAAPVLVRGQVLREGWRGMLEPYPWLAGVALASVAVYLPLAGRDMLRRRKTAEDRARLAVLAVPLAGLGVMVFAVSYRGRAAVTAAAISEVLVLAILIAALRRRPPGTPRTRGRPQAAFPAAAALTGGTLMPLSTLLPVTALAALALACAILLAVTGRGALAPRQTSLPGDVLVSVAIMVAAVGAGYLWLTVHG